MTNETEEVILKPEEKINVWVKPNKKQIMINECPHNEAKAKELGWKKKG